MNIIKKLSVLALAGLLTFSGCTDMDDMNIDKKGLTLELLKNDAKDVGAFIPPLLRGVMKITPEWHYMYQQNLGPDVFSGYMASGSGFANGNNHHYSMNGAWNDWGITLAFDNMAICLNLEIMGIAQNYPDLNGIMKIIRVFTFHRIVDTYGPLPYTTYGTINAKFDSEQEAYTAFFKDLEEAINVLTTTQNTDETRHKVFTQFDVSNLEGKYTNWVKLANTLRMRLAMRISDVDPTTAKVQAEAAANHEFGMLDNLPFLISHTGKHPLFTIGGWTDINLGAPVESFLKGYEDPRLEEYALPSADLGVIKGFRTGVDVGDAIYKGHSRLNIIASDAVQLMGAGESYFLKAEAALKGWNVPGSAKENYEAGIAASFARYGVGLGDYLTSTNKPSEYIDAINSEYSIKEGDPILSTVTVAWDDASNDEERLEKIITQKWIATFPDGVEAWSEHRRTGYPKLFPNMINKSGGEIPNGEFIKRLTYPPTLTTSNATAVEDAVTNHLKGNDSPGQRLWWDID